MEQNIAEVQRNGSFFAFSKMRPGGDWDYNRKFGYTRANDYAGNFNFGACGAALGYKDKTLVSIGGGDQMLFLRHGLGVGFPFVEDPYGDTKAAAIRDGERYYNCGCHKH